MNCVRETIAVMGIAFLVVVITISYNTGQQYAFAQKRIITQSPINLLIPILKDLARSPGLLSGNVIEVPFNISINVCGNTLTISVNNTPLHKKDNITGIN